MLGLAWTRTAGTGNTAGTAAHRHKQASLLLCQRFLPPGCAEAFLLGPSRKAELLFEDSRSSHSITSINVLRNPGALAELKCSLLL